MKRSLLISSTGHKNAQLFSPAAALRHGRLQTKNAASNFDEFLPAKLGKGKDLHLRPIENYWAALKQAEYAGGHQARSLDALQRQIRAKILEIDQQVD